MPNDLIFLLLSASIAAEVSGFPLAIPVAVNGNVKEVDCVNAEGQTEDGLYGAAQEYLSGEPLLNSLFV